MFESYTVISMAVTLNLLDKDYLTFVLQKVSKIIRGHVLISILS
uniref:Uncharacterized protein n=1 Tax=Nostoc sp. PCC 9201 TaxID=2099382 RepID=A0A2P0ZGP1_9NOSO|nr:hypothetical protein [Nostoc sp. PCC 9201]